MTDADIVTRTRRSKFSVGMRFGDWTVTGASSTEGKRVYVPVKCICGADKRVRSEHLTRGLSKSCGMCADRRVRLKPENYQWRNCESCGQPFEAMKAKGVWPRFCSKACFGLTCRNGMDRPCAACGSIFRVPASRIDAETCSPECAARHYVGPQNKNYTGHYVHQKTGTVNVRLQRPGYASKFILQHRLVVSRSIGRMLARDEFVLHIDGHKDNNDPSNLFVCSKSEASKRLQGTMPWPEASNLATYG